MGKWNGISGSGFERIVKTSSLLAVLAVAMPVQAQLNQPLCAGRGTDTAQSADDCDCTRFIRCRFGNQPATMSAISVNSETNSGGMVSSTPIVRLAQRPDFNRNIYYKNKLELSVQTGWLPKNIPFVFDFLLGGGYNMTPLKYTLVPVIVSLGWQPRNVGGPGFLRGNWDLNASASFTAIPRGPETRYMSYIMGIRRNFVQPNWRLAPYFEGRLGVGNIDAKEPKGVTFAQGRDLTFTIILHSGIRYNLNPRYGMSAGVAYMHISNLYLSEPRYLNYGINVYGPMVGLNVALGKHRAGSVQ
jgi:hypothetical protein